MKKFGFLLFLTFVPVFVALLGFHNVGYTSDVTSQANVVRNLLVNPLILALLGGVVSLVLRTKRALWWSMIVCFVYSYLGLGLVWGGFAKEGLFGRNTLNSSALFAVIGFVASAFIYGLTTLLRKQFAAIK